jgi:hypothetical protein
MKYDCRILGTTEKIVIYRLFLHINNKHVRTLRVGDAGFAWRSCNYQYKVFSNSKPRHPNSECDILVVSTGEVNLRWNIEVKNEETGLHADENLWTNTSSSCIPGQTESPRLQEIDETNPWHPTSIGDLWQHLVAASGMVGSLRRLVSTVPTRARTEYYEGIIDSVMPSGTIVIK